MENKQAKLLTSVPKLLIEKQAFSFLNCHVSIKQICFRNVTLRIYMVNGNPANVA